MGSIYVCIILALCLLQIAGALKRDYDKLVKQQLQETVRSALECPLLREAQNWLHQFNMEYSVILNQLNEANWNYDTNMTNENALKVESVQKEVDDWLQSNRWQAVQLHNSLDSSLCQDEATDWMLQQLIKSIVVSQESTINSQIAEISLHMSAMYGNATVIKQGQSFNLQPELENILAASRDYKELLWAWKSWHDSFNDMKPFYTQLVYLQNQVAKECGYDDMGSVWRVQDFDDDKIGDVMEQLWQEVKPLYLNLHAYVRTQLLSAYPNNGLTEDGPIPAHLLGNMWAQSWNNIEDIVKADDWMTRDEVTKNLQAQKYTPQRMFKLAESFFTSLGLPAMTNVFWKKSEVVKPADRSFLCHAAAYDMMKKNDYRIRMCTEVTEDMLLTIHHEMGHIEYFMLYSHLPTLFRSGANAAFHEAVGDTIGLSVQTATHLQHVGLLLEDLSHRSLKTSRSDDDISFLMTIALSKVAFLPFGFLIDKWRWDVFAGNINDTNYNEMWWKYRKDYQGIVPPVARSEHHFDPGAKYHIASSTPYSRYFMSHIAQFQLHKALCRVAGHNKPLHQCDIYKSKAAGEKLRAALSLGSSKHWQQIMLQLTGTREFSAQPLLEYFQPLNDWLQQQNSHTKIGWR